MGFRKFSIALWEYIGRLIDYSGLTETLIWIKLVLLFKQPFAAKVSLTKRIEDGRNLQQAEAPAKLALFSL